MLNDLVNTVFTCKTFSFALFNLCACLEIVSNSSGKTSVSELGHYIPTVEDRSGITISCIDIPHRNWKIKKDVMRSANYQVHCKLTT